jgi:Ser-tRNA(Ala) deacylase AlaX
MTTDYLFREDAYLDLCTARVVEVAERGIVLDRTVFYATSGGQPGDRGVLACADGREIPIAGAAYTDPAKTVIAHAPARLPPSATRSTPRSTGTCAIGACACTPRCICSRRSCPIR